MYNAEGYIGHCLNSLLNQELLLDEYEIIVVNDGSNDKSSKIVNDFTKKYSNIILHNQINSGNGAARNAGIKLAKGKYIYFLDSDDYIASNVMKSLLEILEENNLDILGFQSTLTSSSELITSKDSIEKDIGLKLNITDGLEFIANHNYRAEVWWYFIKRDFFLSTGVSFYDRKFVQDSYITPTLFIKSNRVSFLSIDVHRYRQNENSITHKKTPDHIKKHMNDLAFSIKKIDGLINDISHSGCIKRLKNRQHGYVFFFLIRFAKSNMSFKELKTMLENFKSYKAYPISEFIGKDYKGFKYEVLVFILNRSFLLLPFLYLYRIIYRILR